MKFTLPIAPSTNNLYVNAKGRNGRDISVGYGKWLRAAGTDLNAQRAHFKMAGVKMPISENGVVCIYLPFLPAADLDNRFKATLDLLVSHDVLTNDTMSVVISLAAAIDRNLDRAIMQVLVATAEDMQRGTHLVDRRDGVDGHG